MEIHYCICIYGAAWLSWVVRRLAVRQARVRFTAQRPMEVLLLLSEEAMRIQEKGLGEW
jgi:hypothetical protein